MQNRKIFIINITSKVQFFLQLSKYQIDIRVIYISFSLKKMYIVCITVKIRDYLPFH